MHWIKQQNNPLLIRSLLLKKGKASKISLLGYDKDLDYAQDADDLKIIFPEEKTADDAYTLKISEIDLTSF